MAGKQGRMDGCSNGASTETKAEEGVAPAAGCSTGEKPADAAAAAACDVSYSEGKESSASPELVSTGVGSTETKAEEGVTPPASCSAGEKPADAAAAAAVSDDVSDSEGKDSSASPELASTGVSDGEDPVDDEEEEEEDEAPVPPGKCYMAKAAVERFLAHKRTPYVFSDKIVSPVWWRFELELAAMHEEFEDNYAAFQARIREEYEANGYVALPDDYEERRAEINAASEAFFLRELGPPPAEDESDEEDYYNDDEELAATHARASSRR